MAFYHRLYPCFMPFSLSYSKWTIIVKYVKKVKLSVLVTYMRHKGSGKHSFVPRP